MRPFIAAICCLLILVAWVGPTRAQDAAPAPQAAPPADAPQKKAPEPAQGKTAVIVDHDDTDPLGARLAFRLKEMLGRSALMTLSNKDEKRSSSCSRPRKSSPAGPTSVPSMP